MNETIEFLRDFCPSAPVGLLSFFEDSFVQVRLGVGYKVTKYGAYIQIVENDTERLIHDMAHFIEMPNLKRLLIDDFGFADGPKVKDGFRMREEPSMQIEYSLYRLFGMNKPRAVMVDWQILYEDMGKADLLLDEGYLLNRWKQRNEYVRNSILAIPA